MTRVGYYTPFMIFGTILMSIGAGLLTTLEPDTPTHRWIGYQLLYGMGLGGTFQAPNLAAQTVLPRHDVPIGASLMFFFQLLGGAVFLSVGQNVLNNELIAHLAHIPGLDAEFLLGSGATTITHLPEEVRGAVLVAYNESLRKVFVVGAAMACLTVLGALAMEWRSVKEGMDKKKDVEAGTGGVVDDKVGVDEKKVVGGERQATPVGASDADTIVGDARGEKEMRV